MSRRGMKTYVRKLCACASCLYCGGNWGFCNKVPSSWAITKGHHHLYIECGPMLLTADSASGVCSCLFLYKAEEILIAALFDTYSTLMVGSRRTDDCGEPDKPNSLWQAYILILHSFWLFFYYFGFFFFFFPWGSAHPYQSFVLCAAWCFSVTCAHVLVLSSSLVIWWDCCSASVGLSTGECIFWLTCCWSVFLSRKEQCFEISFMPIVLGLLTVFQEQTGLIINAFLYKLP